MVRLAQASILKYTAHIDTHVFLFSQCVLVYPEYYYARSFL